jgi:hypothetical protein
MIPPPAFPLHDNKQNLVWGLELVSYIYIYIYIYIKASPLPPAPSTLGCWLLAGGWMLVAGYW